MALNSRPRPSVTRSCSSGCPFAVRHVCVFVSYGRPPPASFWLSPTRRLHALWIPSDGTTGSVLIWKTSYSDLSVLTTPAPVAFLDGHRCVHLYLPPSALSFSVGLDRRGDKTHVLRARGNSSKFHRGHHGPASQDLIDISLPAVCTSRVGLGCWRITHWPSLPTSPPTGPFVPGIPDV